MVQTRLEGFRIHQHIYNIYIYMYMVHFYTKRFGFVAESDGIVLLHCYAVILVNSSKSAAHAPRADAIGALYGSGFDIYGLGFHVSSFGVQAQQHRA